MVELFVIILICRLMVFIVWKKKEEEDKFMCLRIVVVGDVNIMWFFLVRWYFFGFKIRYEYYCWFIILNFKCKLLIFVSKLMNCIVKVIFEFCFLGVFIYFVVCIII